jgi:serine/threonine protein kinase
VLDEISLGGKTYQLLERLGSGGRERYRAFDRLAGPHGDYRAIHVLPRSPEVQQQLAVLQRLADLRNSNVPFIVEYHPQRDRVYLVVAWNWGVSLKEHLQRVRIGRDTPFSAMHACRLIRGLAHGLCQLHDAWNVNHGDIKPANLILAPQGKSLSTIDFGTAWLTERATKRTAGDGVSGPYSPPEILESQHTPDFRSDQFSVSVVWYELLTGALPYDGAGGKAGLEGMRDAFAGKLIPPSRLSRHPGHVPAGLWKSIDGAVCRGLALDPADRFPQRRAWLNTLDEIHFGFRQRNGLGGFNRRVVDFLTKWFGGRRTAMP